MQRGLDWLNQRLTANLSRQVIYRRGPLSVAVPAVLGRTIVEVEDESGARLRSQVRDYLIAVDALVLGGQPIQPQPGDVIVETEPGSDPPRTWHYEVLPLVGGEAWRYSDPYRRRYRIHTRAVPPEDAP